jgi:hypothetical protein
MGYYAGDPGFFSFVGNLAKGALGLMPGGGVASRAITAVSKVSRIGGLARRGMEITKGAIVKHPVLSAAGGAAAIGAAGVMGGRATMPGMPGHGMHISRKTGRMVRNRHMRVTNPKALKRALRRAHGFAKLAMRTIHLVHPKKKVRFGGFKKHRRK